MLLRLPARVLDSRPYCAERTHDCSSRRPWTSMSLRHSRCQAAVCRAKSASQPRSAACREAACAVARGEREVSAVSTPTYLVSSYERPLLTGKRSCCLLLNSAFRVPCRGRSARTFRSARRVEATAPSVLVPSVRKATSIVPREPLPPAGSPACVIRRAPRPSRASVTVAEPLQCGVIRSRTAPVWALVRSARTS